MTEYELFDLAVSYQSLAATWIGIFLTVFSAFLVVAYTVGKALSIFQTVVVTSSFVIFGGLCVFAAYGTSMQCLRLYEEVMLLNPGWDFFLTRPVVSTMALLLACGIFVAVWFFFNVRRRD